MQFVGSRPLLVKWEPVDGKMYAVLLSRVLEIYSVNSEEALHSISFDSTQTGFDFIAKSSIVVSDEKGRLTLFTGIEKEETISMKIIETEQTRFRALTAC
jgi:hypothetical protein